MRLDAMMTNIPTRSVMKQLDDVEMKVKMLKPKSQVTCRSNICQVEVMS